MCSHHELSDFVEAVERRAFKQAMFAVRKEEVALDIVQDAMIKLAERYAGKPFAELPMLFQRILHTTILDHYRREKTRERILSLFPGLAHRADGEDYDILDADNVAVESSEDTVARRQLLATIAAEVGKLPARQRQAFLLRYWEDMGVAEAALAMGCSAGSVKTHCSRAAATLAKALAAQGIRAARAGQRVSTYDPARVQLQPAITTQPAKPAPQASHGK